MSTDKERVALQAELARELVRLGLPQPEAEDLARRQLAGSGVSSHEPPQHVVPVSRGWVVIRDFANQDVGLFASKEDALADARGRAAAAEAHVIVHDESS